MNDLFALTNDKPKPKPWKAEAPPKRKQQVLFGGMNCLAGQEDLFPTDGITPEKPDVKKQKVTVLMYRNRFIRPIQLKIKRHTIRRERKRPIIAGDYLSHRHWAGKAYDSKQIEIANGTCTAVFPILVTELGYLIGDGSGQMKTDPEELNEFAVSDGFADWADLMAYYRAEKVALPFRGEIIHWE
jgi:hypothetical protein